MELKNLNMKPKNSAKVVGTLAKEYTKEDVKTTQSGHEYLNIGIKTNVRKDANGEYSADFVNTTLWDKDIDKALELSQKAFAQSQKIEFSGTLNNERFESEQGTYTDENGKKWKTVTKFDVNEFEMVNSPSKTSFEMSGQLKNKPELKTVEGKDGKTYEYAYANVVTNVQWKDYATDTWVDNYKNVSVVMYGQNAKKLADMEQGQQINLAGSFSAKEGQLRMTADRVNAGLTKEQFKEMIAGEEKEKHQQTINDLYPEQDYEVLSQEEIKDLKAKVMEGVEPKQPQPVDLDIDNDEDMPF